MDEQQLAGQPQVVPAAGPQQAAPAASPVSPDLVLAASTILVDLNILQEPTSEVSPALLAALTFIMNQAGVQVDLGNPEILTEFLNVIIAGPTAGGPGAAAPGAPAPGAPGAPGVGPSGVEPIEPAPGAPTGLNSPGPKRLGPIGGGGGIY